MARCKNIRFVLISPEELRVPDYIVKDVLEANGIPYKETRSLEESMPELDILYMPVCRRSASSTRRTTSA